VGIAPHAERKPMAEESNAMTVSEKLAHIERQIVKMKATIKGLNAKLTLAKQQAAQLRGDKQQVESRK
jgi:hypothetical protein